MNIRTVCPAMNNCGRNESIQVIGQGFDDPESCFFVQVQSRCVVPGNLKEDGGSLLFQLFLHLEKEGFPITLSPEPGADLQPPEVDGGS